METGNTRIVIAVAPRLTRLALEALFAGVPLVDVVATTDSFEATLESIRQLQPHVLVWQHIPPDLDALDIARALAAEDQEIPLLVLIRRSDAGAEAARILKARSFTQLSCLSMDAPPEALGATLALMRLGFAVLGQEAQAASVPATTTLRVSDIVGTAPLTEKEKEVLTYLMEGRTNKEIATELEIAVRTVEARLASLASKFGVHSRTEIILKALGAPDHAN